MPKFTECPHCGECLTHYEIEEQYCYECERDLQAVHQYRIDQLGIEKVEAAHEPEHITVHVGFAPPVQEENESEAQGMAAGASDPYEPAHPSLYNHDSWIH